MSDVVIVGICPGRLRGAKSQSLRRLSQWCEDVGLVEFEFHNVFKDHIGSPRLKDVDLSVVRGFVSDKRKVIALGSFPSSVLTAASIPHHKIEHPSGLNRNLNDPERELEMLKNLKDYLST